MTRATQEVRPHGYPSKLLNKLEVAEGTMAFHFEKPPGFDFRPGQASDLTLQDPPESDSEGDIRTFSIASAPFEDQLMFAPRMRDTAFKRSLKRVPLGSLVRIGPATGSFTLHMNSAKPAVFLAGGIGITPFFSIVKQAIHDRLPHQLHFFYSNRRPEDAPFLDALENLEKTSPNVPLRWHDDGDATLQENVGRGERFHRQGNVGKVSQRPAGPHLLHCRTSRNGHEHEENACRIQRGRG